MGAMAKEILRRRKALEEERSIQLGDSYCHYCVDVSYPSALNRDLEVQLWTFVSFFHQTWDPLASLSPSRLLSPREIPSPLPGFIDVAMILLGLQVGQNCIITQS